MRDISHLNGVRSGQTKACRARPTRAPKDAVAHSKCQSRSGCRKQREAHERMVSRDTKNSAHKIQKHFLVPTMEFSPNLAGGLDHILGRPSRSGAKNPSLSFQLRGQQGRSEGRDGQREREKTRSRRCSTHRSTHPTASQRFPPPQEHPTHPPSEGGAAAAASTPQHARICHSAIVSIPTPLGQDTLAAGVRTPRYMRILIHY